MFHNDGEGGNDRSAEKRARNQIGTYVRVFGNVSVGQNVNTSRRVFLFLDFASCILVNAYIRWPSW